jgi:hypothetical protein
MVELDGDTLETVPLYVVVVSFVMSALADTAATASAAKAVNMTLRMASLLSSRMGSNRTRPRKVAVE